jgi:hypothetical protein
MCLSSGAATFAATIDWKLATIPLPANSAVAEDGHTPLRLATFIQVEAAQMSQLRR